MLRLMDEDVTSKMRAQNEVTKMNRDLERLVRRAKERDPDAFTELMESQKYVLYKTARAILDNDEDAADAIQDTILTCWEKLDLLKENQFFRAWITKILINKCTDLLRMRKRVVYVEEYPEIPAKEEVSDAEWKELLAILDEEHRLVVTLYYAQGFRTKEIARILGITDSAVRSRLARARERVKKYCQEAEAHERL